MILNLNKDFFLGAIIWYLMVGCLCSSVLGLIGEERSKKYSVVDNLLFACLCLGWVLE